MSGGVDSSVAALLLQRQGYDVVGVFMRGFNVDGCQDEDAEDARRVAGHIGVPFYVWDFEDEYKKYVVDYMVEGYRRGITPNPDVMCNKEIKFGFFMQKALAMGADFVATGHYVKIKHAKGDGSKLFQGKDPNKDQSYFLWTLTQKQLKRCLFPIGDYLKPQVRAIAKKAELPTADKKDSQGICFLGQISLAEFLQQYIPSATGDVVTIEGKRIGTHGGVANYTIGQRHGLKIAGKNPYYVTEKDAKANQVTVVEDAGHPALFKEEVLLDQLNMIGKAKLPLTCYARVRYRQPLTLATLTARGKKGYKLAFKKPQKFVAPGQSAVFYAKNGQMLGGGVIL